jgi:S1-C subfamily serine protease
VNRTPVRNLDALRLTIGALKPGDPLVLQVERDGELMYVAGRAE